MDTAADSASVTVGTINANSVTGLTGPAVDLLAVFAAKSSAHVTNLAANVTVNIDESGTGDSAVSVADANLIDSYTTGAITGTILETDSATLSTLNSDTDNANAYTITVVGAADAGDLVTIETKTSEKVTMTGLTTVTGTLAEAEALFTLHDDEKVNLGTSPSIAITLSDTNVAVAHVNTLSSQTSGVVTATIFEGDYSTLSGLTATGTGTENVYAITASENLTVTQANALQAKTNGVITATISTGDISTLKTLTDEFSNNVYTITITDAGGAAASDINNKSCQYKWNNCSQQYHNRRWNCD